MWSPPRRTAPPPPPPHPPRPCPALPSDLAGGSMTAAEPPPPAAAALLLSWTHPPDRRAERGTAGADAAAAAEGRCGAAETTYARAVERRRSATRPRSSARQSTEISERTRAPPRSCLRSITMLSRRRLDAASPSRTKDARTRGAYERSPVPSPPRTGSDLMRMIGGARGRGLGSVCDRKSRNGRVCSSSASKSALSVSTFAIAPS
mmetsp:Transcript_44259/g.146669  ORF Transcript_44259/g.146669 Transcript_44259/m.146669 type:complete len:206 (+) Transcript_44259:491-1108(+)